MSATHAIAQLRHLYAQMVEGHVRDTKRAATGLLGPAIEELERFMDNRPASRTEEPQDPLAGVKTFHPLPDTPEMRDLLGAAATMLRASRTEETPETFCRGCGHLWTSHGDHGCGASGFRGPCECHLASPGNDGKGAGR